MESDSLTEAKAKQSRERESLTGISEAVFFSERERGFRVCDDDGQREGERDGVRECNVH